MVRGPASVPEPVADVPEPSPLKAVAFMLTATIFIAATTLLAKALGNGRFGEVEIGLPLHPFQVSFGRFLFAWIAIVTVAALLRPRLVRPHWPLHIARTVCGAAGVTLMFAAAAAIPLADATAISFLNPVFAMILAIPLLGESVGRWRWTAAGLSFLGALILIRPGGDAIQVGALLALGAALILGLEITFIKRLSGRERPLQILLLNNTLGLTLVAIAVLPFWQPPTPMQWAFLAALGVLMAGAQFCFVNAVARADASFVTPFSYATLLFAALYDLAIFGVIPGAVSYVGIALILIGGGVLAWREGVRPAGLSRVSSSIGSRS